MAVTIFCAFVVFVLMLSFYLGNKARSSAGYFAAGGQIHWGVNGIAFAGDYLSAASFLGICGMIAFYGYDGFLYSIGYLAGWIVALFVVAEPMKRMGKYTFTDALDSKFNSKGIQLAAGISTLVVSICYLIPQMVGAGVLVEPLLGLDHHWGVIMVGAIVIFIVATAGMASTTYVQFLKGALLIVFSTVLAIAMCHRGLETTPDTFDNQGNRVAHYSLSTLEAVEEQGILSVKKSGLGEFKVVRQHVFKDKKSSTEKVFVKLSQNIAVDTDKNGINSIVHKGNEIALPKDDDGKLDQLTGKKQSKTIEIGGKKLPYIEKDGFKYLVIEAPNFVMLDGFKCVEKNGDIYVQVETWWQKVVDKDGNISLLECQNETVRPDGAVFHNGLPKSEANELLPMGRLTSIEGKTGEEATTGRVGFLEFFAKITAEGTNIQLPRKQKLLEGESKVSIYYPVIKKGADLMCAGQKFPLTVKPGEKKEDTFMNKLNFASLMLALFFGTSALPHILIRYYTVPSPAAARKSTIVAIAAIGFFYILTLYLGFGATINGVLNPASSNMSAPLLAKSFGVFIFAVISAIAFATVLGTVSGLIVAASGAVAHDLLDRYFGLNMKDKTKVMVGKLAAFAVGLVAIILGIVFKGMNVSFLVGWAFAVAASANLPAIIMLLFWKKTTAQGIVASIIVGIVAAIGIILLGPDMFERYGMEKADAVLRLSQPGIISIPLSFITLVVVSIFTQSKSCVAQEESCGAES